MYKVFSSKTDNLLDALGLAHFFGRDDRYREFWALRDIDLELKRGARLGIIGRNGAGKTTLLKLVTENLAPTVGGVKVNGDVQALLEIGGGLHPEFSGRENIRAALGYLGLRPIEIRAAEEEIADFTELGRFLDQPFKTYSQGMQARLSFAIATSVQPEILIVDEILGAGDAYFFTRSAARMRTMIEGGASVLLVSHGLDQIVRFCDEAIWIDRGRIVMRGPSTEVIKAYEKFIRELEDKRLLAKNRKSSSSRFDAFERESYTEQIVVDFIPHHGPVDVRQVSLTRDGAVEDTVAVGDAQDGDATQAAHVVLDGSEWSAPIIEDAPLRRALAGRAGASSAMFNLWFFYPTSTYSVDVVYRSPSGPLNVRVRRVSSGEPLTVQLPESTGWQKHTIELQRPAAPERSQRAKPVVSRWPGEGTLEIVDVQLRDGLGNEQAVFETRSSLTIRIEAAARYAGTFPLTAGATIYRADGVLVSNHVGGPYQLTLQEEERFSLDLRYDSLNLGDGQYVFSVALFRTLSQTEASTMYDLLDRSYEFQVVGNTPFDNGIFSHPAVWSLHRSVSMSASASPSSSGSASQ